MCTDHVSSNPIPCMDDCVMKLDLFYACVKKFIWLQTESLILNLKTISILQILLISCLLYSLINISDVWIFLKCKYFQITKKYILRNSEEFSYINIVITLKSVANLKKKLEKKFLKIILQHWNRIDDSRSFVGEKSHCSYSI